MAHRLWTKNITLVIFYYKINEIYSKKQVYFITNNSIPKVSFSYQTVQNKQNNLRNNCIGRVPGQKTVNIIEWSAGRQQAASGERGERAER